MTRPAPKSRRGLTTAIRRLVEPHLYESGYVTPLDRKKGLLAGSRPYRVWKPPQTLDIRGFVLGEVLAMTEDGIMTDATGGGCMTEGYGAFPIEDLARLHKKLSVMLAA